MVRPPRIVVGLLLAGFAIAACTNSGKQATTSTSGAATDTSRPGSSTQNPPSTSSSASIDPNAADPGSAGDIPDNQVFVVFTDSAGPFTVKVPEGWARADAGTGSIRFTDNFNAIDLSVTPASNAPSEQSALATELPSIQAGTSGFVLHTVSTVQRKAGSAVKLAYDATSAANTVTGKTVTLSVERYEFWAGGTEAVVTLSGPLNADNVDPWRTVTDSFSWA